jgi:hypothetical protein
MGILDSLFECLHLPSSIVLLKVVILLLFYLVFASHACNHADSKVI